MSIRISFSRPNQRYGLINALLMTACCALVTLTPAHAYTGPEVYQQQCLLCHGETGDGKGPLAGTFNPPPVSLRTPLEQAKLETVIVTRSDTIAGHGIAPLYTKKEVLDLIEYVMTLSATAAAP